MSDDHKIYMHKNKINGKMYIGQTSKSLNRRWNNGKGYVNCPYFNHAIEKYGWENFEHILLHDGLSKNEADELEKYYIREYKSYMPEHGYNISLGGAGLSGGIKYKDIYQYTLDGYFVKHYNDVAEVLNENPDYNASTIRGVYNEIYSSAYGFQWRSYYKEKIEDVKEHKANIGKTKIVYQYGLNGEFLQRFNDIKEASEVTGFSRSGISKACNGHQKTFEGYQWSFDYIENIKAIDLYVICQYGIDGRLIKTYNTPKEASLSTGISSSTIINCYKGRYDLAGGYIWKRYNTNYEDVPNQIEVKLKKTKLIALIDDNDNCIKVYRSAKKAAEDLCLKNDVGIYNVCNGIYSQTCGYRFKYIYPYQEERKDIDLYEVSKVG